MEGTKEKKFFDHILAGLGAMIPFVVAGGILMALGFALAGADAMTKPAEGFGSLGQVLYGIGSANAMGLMFVVVAGFIAVSVAGQLALLPGMVGGSIATSNGSTFLGAVFAGLLAGYTVKFMDQYIKIPKALSSVYSILLLPVISSLVVGFVSIYLIGVPVAYVMNALTEMLGGMQGGNMLVLCAILGGMMAVDMGGPILRVAYFFGVAAVVAAPGQPQVVMAAVIVGGMTPPLGMALAALLQKHKFTGEEREAGKAAWILGASLICEGVIPFALRDPKRVIPAGILGSAVAGLVVGAFETGTTVVHGGIFILPIPGAVREPLGFVVAVLAGTVVTAVAALALKRPVEAQETAKA